MCSPSFKILSGPGAYMGSFGFRLISLTKALEPLGNCAPLCTDWTSCYSLLDWQLATWMTRTAAKELKIGHSLRPSVGNTMQRNSVEVFTSIICTFLSNQPTTTFSSHLRKREIASNYCDYWITVQGSPILTSWSSLLRHCWTGRASPFRLEPTSVEQMVIG